MNKTFVTLLTVILLSPLFSLLVATPARADWLIDRSGVLIKIDSRILGDDDENEIEIEDESKSEDSKDSSEVKSTPSSTAPTNVSSEREKKERERALELAKKKVEMARKTSDLAKQELKKKVEMNEIKSKTSNIKRESEIESEDGKLKIKQKIRDANGKETETELQMENGEELQIESKSGDEAKKFKIRPGKDDGLEMEKAGVKIGTKLPISINENNELVVTRPDGTTKIVTVMPDQALKMLREQNITPDDKSSDAGGDSVDLPELEEEDGEPVYKIDGKKQEKVLGLFKVSYKTKSIVSAETGELVRTELSGLDRFMSIFSF